MSGLTYKSDFKKNITTDKHLQELIRKEKEHWNNILVRIIYVVIYLSRQNLAFRETNNKINVQNNRNFFSLVEMIVEWDPTMQRRLDRIKNNEINSRYLSHKIQNKLTNMLGNEVKGAIIQKIK